MTTSPKQTAAKSDRRQAILTAALRLFARKGYEATPVPLIAKEVGLAVGGLYRYYPGKEQLANAVYQEAVILCTQIMLDGFSSEASVREKFRHLWKGMHRFAEEHPDEFVFLELHNHTTYLSKKSADADKKLMSALDDFVKDAQKQKVMRKMEPALVISIVLGVYLAYFRSSHDGELANAATALTHAEEAAWRAVAV